MRRHTDDSWVCMYRDTPGVYFDAKGFEIPASKAREANFDVGGQLTEKMIRQQVAELEESLRVKRVDEVESLREKIGKMSDDELVAEFGQVAGSDPDPEPVTLDTNLRTDAEVIINRTNAGKPRETSKHKLKHRGRGTYDVLSKITGMAEVEKVSEAVAIDRMIVLTEEALNEPAA